MKQKLTSEQKQCSHRISRSEYKTWINDWTGEEECEWEYWNQSTEEDLDLHRTKCTQCGMIGYYSGAARNWYEKGISSNGIKGLG